MLDRRFPLHVSLVAVPEAMVSTVGGLYDVLNSIAVLGAFNDALPRTPPFHAELVTPASTRGATISGLPIDAGRPMAEVARTDIVIVPSLMPEGGVWRSGRYPQVVEWLARMQANGAMLCSACTGVLLLAETGLFDGREATIHPMFVDAFRRDFPAVRLTPEHVLVTAGERSELVTSGSTHTWHDLALYLVARHLGATAAQEIAKFFLLQWHTDGQALYAVFAAPMDHGDAVVRGAQDWLHRNFTRESPVEQVVCLSGVPARTFKRRFTRATGHAPIVYVQHLRIDEAKRRLERTDAAIDAIGWAVGYETPSFFRRLFKRFTGVTPAAYRRKLKLPAYARTGLELEH